MFESDYGLGARLLHRMALGSTMIAEASFDMERLRYGSLARDVSQQKHVFVSGLARAGTTILMREIYQSGLFRSLTYRDMPFVLAPNLWSSLSWTSRKQKEATQRAHEDGILVDFDSPEALEEVFWRVFSGAEYIRPQQLVPMRADEETIEKFRAYIGQILAGTENLRYLSKNNNNILRLGSLTQAFPQAVILVPFRQPLQHAFSLWNQHQHFVQRHAADSFSRSYMNWLVHHEFGSDHRPFQFDPAFASAYQPEELNYWLELWTHVYAYLAEHLPPQAALVSYEKLCEETETVWHHLAEKCELPAASPPTDLKQSSRPIEQEVNPALHDQAAALYQTLQDRSL